MVATEIGIAFVVLASIGLVAALLGILVWLLAVIVRGMRARAFPDKAQPTTRR